VGGQVRRVLVSHAGPDTSWAEWVAWHLERSGVAVELDRRDWLAGEDFMARMQAAMDRPGLVVVALWSAAYFEPSRYSAMEWNAAAAAAHQGKCRVVPLRVEDVAPPVLHGTLIHVDLFGVGAQTARARLLRAVKGEPGQLTDRLMEPPFPEEVPGVEREGAPRLPGVLPGVWRVPSRNAAFTGRDEVLARLRSVLAGGGRLALQALQGMGGVGKTSLAVEYAHRFAGDFEAVWWIDAENPSLVGEQLRELAVAVGVARPGDDAASAVAGLRVWLRQQPGWLLVFDNAEAPKEVLPLLPEGPGQVLVTSRDGRWRQALPGSEPVAVFARAESVALLRTHLPAIADEAADQVAAALGDLPLAVAQAALFMAESGLPPGDYLAELERSSTDVLREGTPQGYPVSLAAGLRVSLERLADEDIAAHQLLVLASFLAPEPIPLAWITTAAAADVLEEPVLEEPLASAAASPLALRRVLARLTRYGLVRLVDDEATQGGNPILHRLTAAIVRDALPAERAARERRRAEQTLIAADPGDVTHWRTWPAWAELLPHLLTLNPADSDNPALRWLTLDATYALLASGNTRAGHDLASSLHQAWTTRLDAQHPHTLTASDYLALAYRDAGDSRTARRLNEEALRIRRDTLGDDHPATLTSANNLAIDLYALGQVAVARELDQDTLARRKRMLGDDHPDTLMSASNLAADLHVLGEVAAARELDEETLARRRRMLGEDHPDTLTSANNLAGDLRVLGEVAAARELDQDTLARRRRVLGEDHPNTLNSANNLAADLHELGEVAAARELDQDTLARRRRMLGEDHPDTLTSANNLAIDLHELGEVAAARELDQDTLARRRRVLGEDHPHTLNSANNLANDLRELGEVAEARELDEDTRRRRRDREVDLREARQPDEPNTQRP
jgi:hypothetical protein